jgi:hypothetical protein
VAAAPDDRFASLDDLLAELDVPRAPRVGMVASDRETGSRPRIALHATPAFATPSRQLAIGSGPIVAAMPSPPPAIPAPVRDDEEPTTVGRRPGLAARFAQSAAPFRERRT